METTLEARNNISWSAWKHLRIAIFSFLRSEVRFKAIFLFGTLIVLLFAISGNNILMSFIGRDFMTAVEQKNKTEFQYQALLYLSIFAIATGLAAVIRFVEERLSLVWRKWQTQQIMRYYLRNHTYLQLLHNPKTPNPDQNIAEDVKTFTTMSLSFLIMIFNALLTVIAFSSVLWHISPTVFGAAVLYSIVGTGITILLGKRLVRLNYKQLDKEAFFRTELLHLKENADSIALLKQEYLIQDRLLIKLSDLAENLKKIIRINLNLAFFTNGYNFLIPIIPIILIAPDFIDGKITFGVISQSAMAFAQLVGGFSLIITQFQSISNYTAVISRLGNILNAMRQSAQEGNTAIVIKKDQKSIAIHKLTLIAADSSQVWLKDFSLDVKKGSCILFQSANEAALVGLFRTLTGIKNKYGRGEIQLPPEEQIAFLTERPYFYTESLREIFYEFKQHDNSHLKDETLHQLLHIFDLDYLIPRLESLADEPNWQHNLSLTKQQLLLISKILVQGQDFIVFDRLSSSLGASEIEFIMNLLNSHNITVLAFENTSKDQAKYYQQIVTIHIDGSWQINENTHRSE